MKTIIKKLSPFFLLLFADVKRADVIKQASAMAYVTVFSIVPSLAAIFTLIALYKPFLGENSFLLNSLREFILTNLAAGAGETAVHYLDSFIANLDLTKIGVTGFIGITISLILLLRQIELALNRIWCISKGRNLFRRFVYFWTFLTLGVFIISLAVGIFTDFNLVNLIPFSGVVKEKTMSSTFIKSLVPWVSVFVFFILLYKIVPNCNVSLKSALSGALPATIFSVLSFKVYGYYATNISAYKEIYGVVAAVPIFLMWLYIVWFIVLTGAIISFRVQKGFSRKELESDIPIDISAQIKLVAPYAALSAVYCEFQKGKGEGISKIGILNATNLPEETINEAINMLIEKNWILSRYEFEGQENYFPAKPIENTIYFSEDFKAPFKKWLQKWEQSLNPELVSIFKKIYSV